ncbi:hypothetical protein AWENTII_002045 [Aspergillus wentii]
MQQRRRKHREEDWFFPVHTAYLSLHYPIDFPLLRKAYLRGVVRDRPWGVRAWRTFTEIKAYQVERLDKPGWRPFLFKGTAIPIRPWRFDA